jgi:hypothetical protein
MGEKVRNKKLVALYPSALVTLWAGYTFFSSLDREPWRIIFSGIGFFGLLAMNIFFIRKIKNQTNTNQVTE